jgi:aminoglycoside phosphotransferase (APT) family kinase protein
MSDLPEPAVLTWATSAVGAVIEDVESLHPSGHRDSGTFRLRIGGDDTAPTDLILKIPVPGWIDATMVTTNARALQLAYSYGITAPRLIAADLDGRAAGTVATLETMLPGSSAMPPIPSVARIESAGAVIARVHAYELAPREDLPRRPRPVAVDDFAGERRRGRMPTTPLLRHGDERARDHGMPPGEPVFVHGDVWPGNLLWTGDTCTALIDWKTAGAGHPGVDLGGLRLQLALHYGPDAAELVLRGWRRESGRDAEAMPYWDAIAALNTPTELQGWPGFADDGSRLDAAAITGRRDAFLQAALDRMPG